MGVEVTPKDSGAHDQLLEERRRNIPGSRSARRVPASAPEVVPILEVRRRERAPAPGRDAGLGVEENTRNREPRENVKFESTPILSGKK